LTESEGVAIDRLIGLKFPAYLIPHPNKVIWLLHQHRPAYDLWDHPLGDLTQHPNGVEVRDSIRLADQRLIPEAKAIFANSKNVAARLSKFNNIRAAPLYHPPQGAEDFYCQEPLDYLFFPSRITPNKRQHLVIEALKLTRNRVRVALASCANHPTYFPLVQQLVAKHGLESRAEFKGDISEADKKRLYAHCSGVIYPPVDEDYGYVTLEAMLSSKPVITCSDSGGPVEFVMNGETGVVAEPTPQSLAHAMDELWENPARAKALGRNGRALYDSMGITWSNVIERLLA
jgi:glycosyltransferase involved in cell wall biosynthesis